MNQTVRLITALITGLTLLGFSCNRSLTTSDVILSEARLTAPDSEFSHTMMNPTFNGYASPQGTIVTQAESQLVANIKAYTEEFMNNQDKVYLSKTSHYDCTITLFGYDDLYAYTNVLCTDPGGSAFSIPFRFEYNSTDYAVLDFKMLGNDTPVGIIFPQSMAEAYYLLKI